MKIFMLVMLLALLSATLQKKSIKAAPATQNADGIQGLTAKLHAFFTKGND